VLCLISNTAGQISYKVVLRASPLPHGSGLARETSNKGRFLMRRFRTHPLKL